MQSFATPSVVVHSPQRGVTSMRASSVSSSSSSSPPLSTFLATCVPGLAPILAHELEELGCQQVAVSSARLGSGVTFVANRGTALRVLLWTRTCHKLLELLCQSEPDDYNYQDVGSTVIIRDRDSLMQFVQDNVNVRDVLGDGKGGLLTLSVQVVATGGGALPPDLSHTFYTALSIKNALCDAVRDVRGDRPNVDTDDPDVPLVAFVRGSPSHRGAASVSVYRQLHSGSLHRRGYRLPNVPVHKAALKESLAAGLLLSAGLPDRLHQLRSPTVATMFEEKEEREKDSAVSKQPSLLVLDPMAGSGTLVLEALLMAADIAPGWCRLAGGLPGHRLPSVTRWKQLDDDNDGSDMRQLWKNLLIEAKDRAANGLRWVRTAHDNGTLRFVANDAHGSALGLLDSALLAASDAMAPGLESLVEVHQGDCATWDPFATDHTSSTANTDDTDSIEGLSEGTAPPHNESQQCLVVCNPPWGERLTEDVHESWESLREFLRHQCPPDRTEAWILSGDPTATKHLGLRRSASIPLQTGKQQLRWLRYELHSKPPVKDGKNRDKVRDAKPRLTIPSKRILGDYPSSGAAPPRTNWYGKNDNNYSFERVTRSPGGWKSRSTTERAQNDNGRPRQRPVATPKSPSPSRQEKPNEWLL